MTDKELSLGTEYTVGVTDLLLAIDNANGGKENVTLSMREITNIADLLLAKRFFPDKDAGGHGCVCSVPKSLANEILCITTKYVKEMNE